MTGVIYAWRDARRLLAIPVALVALAVAAPSVVLADEPQDTADALIAQITEQAEEAGIDPDAVLDQLLTIDLGEDAAPVQATVREAIERLSGESVVDEENNTGLAGLPAMQAGGVFHIAANLKIETFAAIQEALLPPAPDVRPYDVRESDYSPNTPVLPVINPLLLSGQELPEGLPMGLDDPIVLLHPGGRLTSVQGGGWNVLGTHGAGSYGLGHNADTTERETADGDPWPAYLPMVTGDTIPDTAVDFLGFGIIVNSGSCSLVRLSNNPASSFYTRILARICVGVGAIVGDGAAQWNGEGILDFRTDLAPLWEEASPEVQEAVAEIDGAVEQVPVGDVLDQVLGAISELPGAPEVPEVPAP